MKRKIKRAMLYAFIPLMLLTGCSKDKKEDKAADYYYDQMEANSYKYPDYEEIETNYDSYVYEEDKKDDEIVDVPSDYRVFVLTALDKNIDSNITVGDLKKIKSLTLYLTEQELSWLNYCTGLEELELDYCVRTDVAEQVKSLPSLKSLEVNNAGSAPVMVSKKYFPFVEKLTEFKCSMNTYFDPEYLKEAGVRHMSVSPGGLVSIDYKKLDFLETLNVDIRDREPYSAAICFTPEAKSYLLSQGVDVLAGAEVEKVNAELDEINSQLGIDPKEYDKTKYKKIATYIINNLDYETDEEVREITNFYDGGFLSSALDNNQNDVCGNFASLSTALCLRNGIDSYVLSSGRTGKHAWNLVKIDGKFYYSDLANMDICDYEDRQTGEVISVEEFIDRYGINDALVRFYIFKEGTYDSPMFEPLNLPYEYYVYEDENAKISIEKKEVNVLKKKLK